MNTSPITSWEGVQAYFTFADRPVVIGLILALAIGATIWAVITSIRHENESYREYE